VNFYPLLAAFFLTVAIAFFALKSRFSYLDLPELPAGEGGETDSLQVIIPARNEEARIELPVTSFAGHDVLVVDDESSDRTVKVALAAGASVLPAQARPAGWLGKPNACWTGARASSARWLLFVDADTWYNPGFAESLTAYARVHGLVAASVFPQQVCLSFAERVLLPYAFGLYFCGVNARRVNDPKSMEALANGQCLLIRRDAYEFLQGHRAVATSVIEDVALARLMKRHRMPLHVLRAEGFARVRMYDSFGGIWRGFQKNSFRFLRANPRTGLQVVLAAVVMTSWLPVLAWLWWAGFQIPALVFLWVPALAWWPWYGSLRRSWTAPLAIYLFQLIALTAMFKSLFGLKTAWKGRPV
jgi:glycosyltransferase involved in cell wall biosynthesis